MTTGAVVPESAEALSFQHREVVFTAAHSRRALRKRAQAASRAGIAL
jgi:hypothetical protein